jgi:hypothetical protein
MFGVGVGVRVGGFTASSGVAPYVGLLDDYPSAAAAYSVRLLRGAYTGNAIRVRRSSDNTEQNIGFTALGNLDTTSLTSFCSGTNGFVTTWYDQSGNSNNATQSTAANQPQIVSSGSVITLNSKPSIQSATTLKVLRASNISYNECYISVVFNRTGNSGGTDTLYAFDNSPYNQLFSASSNWSYYTGVTNNTTIPLSTSQKLITQIDNGSDTLFYDNNTLDSTFAVSANISSQTLNLLAYQTSYGSFGNMQEFILYSSSQSTNRTGINTNINTYYGIY